MLRVERQPLLRSKHEIDPSERNGRKREHRQRIDVPRHLFIGAHSGETVDESFDRHEHGRKPGALAFKDARHVAAQRFCQRDDNDEEGSELQPAGGGHG